MILFYLAFKILGGTEACLIYNKYNINLYFYTVSRESLKYVIRSLGIT